MKYMGSKAALAKHLLPIMMRHKQPSQTWVEPFVGGANMIERVAGKRLASDNNGYLIAMWQALTNGWKPPAQITREQYNAIRANQTAYDPALVGYVGFNCSYSGKWWGGYAGKVNTRIGTTRDYIEEAYRNVVVQATRLVGVTFVHTSYDQLEIPDHSFIYCDPPYADTTKYATDFDSTAFWEWCRQMHLQGHTVYISEYKAPPDFECVYSRLQSSSLSANGTSGSSIVSTECLFTQKRVGH